MYSLFEKHYDKGYRFNGEIHNFWECVYVMDGSVCVSADGYIHNLEAGDLIFHKPLEMHKFFSSHAQGVTHFTFSFSAEGSFSDEIANKVFCLNQEQKAIMHAMINYTRRQLQQYPVPQELPFYIQPLALFEINPLFSQTFCTYVCQIVLSVAQNGSLRSVTQSPDAGFFKKAVDYMHGNLHLQISVNAMAEYLNVSPSTVKRLFSKYAGMSVHKYIVTLKIRLATDLLNRGLRVSEAAERLGFSSQGYFSAAYKRETGKSPSYIKQKL